MNPPVNLPRFDPALLVPMRELWEQSLDISAARIAGRFSVTKNTVIGQAHRRGWAPRKIVIEPRTLHDRMDEAHARMDAVIAETRIVP
jgi:hypothetical protein